MSYNEKEPLIEPMKQLLIEPASGFGTSSLLQSLMACFPGLISLSESEDDNESETDSDNEQEEIIRRRQNANNVIDIQNKHFIGELELKLSALRQLMKKYNIGVYIIGSEDEHQSEYTAISDKRRQYISGFTGSAGIAVVTLEDSAKLEGDAILSTDGRYFIQAGKELDPKHWKLLKQGVKGYPSWTEYAISKAKSNPFSKVISTDPRLISVSIGQYFEKAEQVSFRPLEINLVDEIWGSNKPQRSQLPLYELPLAYSGESSNHKLTQVRSVMSKYHGDYLVISSLDETAWLFNLRCDDAVPFNAVFFSYAIVSQDEVVLYVDLKQISSTTDEYLQTVKGLKLKPYQDFYKDLSQLKASNKIILPSMDKTNFALYSAVAVKKDQIVFLSVVSNIKIVKNPVELANAQIAQDRDSYAFILFTAWLERQLKKNKTLTEWDAALKIYDIRTKLPHFKGLSYETIASSGINSALPHYGPTAKDHIDIDPKTIFLVDSGAHYLEGTTDITRTYKFGDEGLTNDMIKYYTLVLKGHIALALSQFPEKSPNTGIILDGYARQFLWMEGLDFNHGTGHGVGSFGDVHEGPVYIPASPTIFNEVDVYQEGVVLTDEPGYYLEGQYGFRIESDLAIVKGNGSNRNGTKFLKFSYMTKVPFCKKLIDKAWLSPREIEWINSYHLKVRDEYAGQLLKEGHITAYTWLLKETSPL